MQYTRKDGVIFRVKPVNKADINIINWPLTDSTSNVTIDSGNNLQSEMMC